MEGYEREKLVVKEGEGEKRGVLRVFSEEDKWRKLEECRKIDATKRENKVKRRREMKGKNYNEVLAMKT